MRTFFFVASIVTLASLVGCGSDVDSNTGGGGQQSTSTSTGTSAVDPPGPKDPSAALEAAVFLGSCLPDDGINRNLSRIYTRKGSQDPLDQALVDRTTCLAGKANGCEAVADCLGARVDLTGPCEVGCEGSVLRGCDDSLKFEIDCARLGLECSVEAGTCIKPPLPAACDYDTFQSTCEGGAPVVCLDGVAKGPVCADLGLSCGLDSWEEEMVCKGAGASCMANVTSSVAVTFDEGQSCQGGKLDICVNDGKHLLDCGTLASGFTCQSSAGGAFCGLGAACDPNSGVDTTCDGDSVVVCNAGRVDKVDCKALGFTGCSPKYGVCIPSVYSQL